MESLNVSRELAKIRERTAKLVIASVVIHVVAGVYILTREPYLSIDNQDDYLVTEITWLDTITPIEIEPTEATAPAEAAPRETEVSPAVAPAPVIVPAASNRALVIADRLASLRGNQTSRRAVTDAATTDPAPKRSSLLASFVPGAGRQATDLARSGKESVVPVTPAPAPIRRAAVAVTTVAEQASPRPEKASITQEISQEISPGVSLAGPVSDRALLSYGTPSYPDWAKQDGVEVTVALYFTVLPNGRVKENVMIEKTSGYQDFDQRARSSLLSWRFEMLGGGATSEQWGRIEFNYRLKQAG
jgi:TonB family protein